MSENACQLAPPGGIFNLDDRHARTHSHVQPEGCTWVAGIRTILTRLTASVVAASRECPVVENWNHWEIDAHMKWNSILCNFLCALEVARPKGNKSRSALLHDIILSTLRECPAGIKNGATGT